MLGGGHLRTLFGGEGRGLEKEDAFCLERQDKGEGGRYQHHGVALCVGEGA